MKKLLLFVAISAQIIMMSCTTEYYESSIPGPTGPQGPQGPAGESAYVFEYTEVTFAAPDYEVILEYPTSFEGLNSDVVLAYLLWDVQDINGQLVDVWRPMPQQVFTSYGTIQYNYDFTAYDVKLFLEGTVAASDLEPIDTDDWVVRLVVVPGDFWNSGRIEQPAYEDLMNQLQHEDLKISRKQAISRRK
jgi:hypothetical protein